MRPIAVEFLQAEQSANTSHMQAMADTSTMLYADMARGCADAAGCTARGTSEVTENRSGSTCRDATKSEAANGYGAMCQFELRFMQRAADSTGPLDHGKMCVKVQESGGKLMVMDAYRILRTDTMLGSLPSGCMPLGSIQPPKI